MALIFAAIGGAIIIYAFRLKELPIMTTIGLFLGCIFLVFAAVSIKAPDRGGDCHIDWDGRSNSTVCD
jgi:hypothetical protein